MALKQPERNSNSMVLAEEHFVLQGELKATYVIQFMQWWRNGKRKTWNLTSWRCSTCQVALSEKLSIQGKRKNEQQDAHGEQMALGLIAS